MSCVCFGAPTPLRSAAARRIQNAYRCTLMLDILRGMKEAKRMLMAVRAAQPEKWPALCRYEVRTPHDNASQKKKHEKQFKNTHVPIG